MREFRSNQQRDAVISSVRVEENARHARLTIFNRGGNAGILTVDTVDWPGLVARLIPTSERFEVKD